MPIYFLSLFSFYMGTWYGILHFPAVHVDIKSSKQSFQTGSPYVIYINIASYHSHGIASWGDERSEDIPDSKVNGVNVRRTWGRQDPGGPHVGHMNFAIWDISYRTNDFNRLANLITISLQHIIPYVWICSIKYRSDNVCISHYNHMKLWIIDIHTLLSLDVSIFRPLLMLWHGWMIAPHSNLGYDYWSAN